MPNRKTQEPWPQLVDVYAIEHIDSGDAYVGSTYRGYLTRYQEHIELLLLRKHSSPKFQNKWWKYGKKAFRPVLLGQQLCANLNERVQFEAAWVIKKGNLNCRPVSADGTFFSMSDDVREKVSKSIRKLYNDHPELREKVSIRLKIKNPGMSGNKKRWAKPGASEVYSKKMKVYWANKENKQKQSDYFKINNPMFSQEVKERHAELMRTDEYRKRQGEHSKRVRWAQPGAKEHYSSKMKAYWANPENRKKQADRTRASELRKKLAKEQKILADLAMPSACISTVKNSGT